MIRSALRSSIYGRMLRRSVAASAAAVMTVAGIAGAAGTPVPSDIQSVFSKPMYKDATWGLRVMDGARVLVDYHPDHQFFIGSVRKVFSVGSLLNTVGASHTYDTPVYRQGSLSGKTLTGNLVLVASGDLTMGGRKNPDGSIAYTNWDHNEANELGNAVLSKPDPLAGYKQLAAAVKAAGIDHVAGDVVIDDRLFPPFNFRDQFDIRPIFVNDDMVDMAVVPAKAVGPQTDFAWRPHSAALGIDNKLVAGAAGSEATPKVDPFEPKCIGAAACSAALSGNLPIDYVPALTGTPPLVRTVRIVQPANYARTVFIEALQAAGVAVDAPAVAQNPVAKLPAQGSYQAASRVALLTGMTYGQDSEFVMKVSYNIGADTSLMLLGVARGAHTYAAALASESSLLGSKYGVPASDYHFVDGSGGGDTSAKSSAVTKMLEELAKAPEHAAFLRDLPILGKDGSLSSVTDFEKDTTLKGAAGQVRAKTGTWVDAAPDGKPILKGQAFGGYITTKSGKHLTYQLVVNDVAITGIPDVIKVFQDEGRISAMLWRDN